MPDIMPAMKTVHLVTSGGTPSDQTATDPAASPGHPPDTINPIAPSDARYWLAAIADSSDDAIVGKDLNGIITSWNNGAAKMFGFTAEEIVGQPITCIIPPDRLGEESSILARVRRNEKIVHFETERQRKDGTIFPILLSVSSIRDDQNHIIGVSKIARDLTERDRREEKLRAANAELARLARHLVKERDKAKQANQAKSRFLAAMSHELRTPLNGILGYARLMHIEGGLNATQRARVEGMMAAGQHLLQMITCVLDLTEIEAERVEIQPVECDVQEIAAACLDLVRPTAEAKKLALSIAVTPGTPRNIVADPMRLRQILFNLLGNATKFTTEGAIELRLRILPDRSALRVEITDTGPGIAPDQRQRLFQDFERLDADGGVEGSGLGLALSSRLAGLMGGCLGYDDNPGGGSVFWLELPLKTVAASTQPAQAAAMDTAAGAMETVNVLVVDDVTMNRDIAAAFLRAAGHTVTCVASGEEAIAAVAATDFDVVLMDVRMPEMDGLEATRRIRALGGGRGEVPIVALTAHAFAGQVEECRKAGMDGHLAKPFDPAKLQEEVVRAVRVGRVYSESIRPSSAPPDPLVAEIGADLLVFDASAFNRTARYLDAKTVASYLNMIAERGAALQFGLRQAGDLTLARDELADAAHTLAGSAGMFGFERLTAVGRLFEHAIKSGAPDAPSLARALSTSIAATLEAIKDHPVQSAA